MNKMKEVLSITEHEILRRLAARKFGVKLDPLPSDALPALLDVEEAFPDTVESKNHNTLATINITSFDSEPE